MLGSDSEQVYIEDVRNVPQTDIALNNLVKELLHFNRLSPTAISPTHFTSSELI